MALITPWTAELPLDYRWLLAWTAPYYLASCYILVRSLWNEDNERKKRSRFIATIIIVPTLLAVLVLINVANVFMPELEFFRYVSLFIIYSLTVALLCTFLYGVLGVKLRFERDPLENTMKAVSSGTTLLNHSIKNEIGKIAISSENLKQAFAEPVDDAAMQQLQIIANASDHMLAMVNRIHSQTKAIVLVETACRLDQLVGQCLLQHQELLKDGGIEVITNYSCNPTVLCDAVHLREAMGNILMNAVEAMPGGGMVEVRLEAAKKGVVLSFMDNGKGISEEQLSFVFDPFFSTKNRSQNFGLGLSYVYNVMQKSGGSIVLSSREHGGTEVRLLFPRKKMISSSREGNME